MIQYKNYSIIRPDQGQKDQISQLINEQDGSVFHDVFINTLISDRFSTDFFYMVDDPETISNCTPIHKVIDAKGLTRYHFKPLFDIPYAGFVGRSKIEPTAIKAGLFESFKYEGFPYANNGVDTRSEMWRGQTSLVDLSLTEDEIFEKIINAKKRNKIRKAVKEGIQIKRYNNKTGMEYFWEILEPLHKKLGFNASLNFDYYNTIFNYYSKLDQAYILIAYKDDIALSGVLILGNGNYMHYYKGASVFGMRNEGQGELLQWEAIKYAKELNTKYYDLCNLNKEKLPAIYSFKTGISNHIIPYEIVSINNKGYQVLNRLKKHF